MKRILTAGIMTPLMVWVMVWAPEAVFLVVLAAVAVLCFYEFAGIAAQFGIPRPGPLGYAAGLILLLTGYTHTPDPSLLITLTALAALTMSLSLTDLRQSLLHSAALVLGVIYTFGVWRWAIPLRQHGEPHSYWLLFASALCWVGDIAAYYAGKNFGRHKMAPRISPGKTWEGAVASLVGSMVFGFVFLAYLMPAVQPWQRLLLAAVGNVAGQIGDLAESALKRGAGVKDSGTMLPGHGGWLDRVDSSLFSVPVTWALICLLGL